MGHCLWVVTRSSWLSVFVFFLNSFQWMKNCLLTSDYLVHLRVMSNSFSGVLGRNQGIDLVVFFFLSCFVFQYWTISCVRSNRTSSVQKETIKKQKKTNNLATFPRPTVRHAWGCVLKRQPENGWGLTTNHSNRPVCLETDCRYDSNLFLVHTKSS